MISFSVAMDPNKGIGYQGSLPWHIKEELQLFKANTMGKHILMGKTTYDGLPRKLVGRIVMVVSRDENYHPEDEVVRNLDQFLKDHQKDETEYIICGGASIYKQAYPYASKAYVSFVKQAYEVDTKWEDFNLKDWNITKEVDYDQFIYRELVRK